MTKDDVGIITEIEMEIDQCAGEEIKEKIMEGSEQVADLLAEEVAHWLKNVIDNLDTFVNEKTKIQIMENCGYNCAEMNKSHIEQALKKREKYKTLDEFLKAEEKTPAKGTRLVRDGDTIYQYYDPSAFKTRCFCSVWRGLKEDETASLTWCHCSKGFVMKLWEAYLGRPVAVELVDSCISGAKECTFVIHL
ncbi:MAG: DUF6144 family protein [Candidatus Methanofastidiosia archaeon]